MTFSLLTPSGKKLRSDEPLPTIMKKEKEAMLILSTAKLLHQKE
jgi:hypothetical protein